MMRKIVIFLLCLSSLPLAAQDTVTLFECYRMALDHAPRMADQELISEIGEIQVEEATAGWYPSLEINGRLSYQSDVVTVALADPAIPVEFPEVPHDQYGLNLDVRQTLYDGGAARNRKRYEQTRTAAELQQLEVDLYGLRSRVNHYYFSILVLQENLRNLEIHLENLEKRREVVNNAVEGGAMLEADLKVIDVEILRIRQSMLEAASYRTSAIDALSVLCGTAFGEDLLLELPVMEGMMEGREDERDPNRPEYALFELQKASLEAGKELAGSKRLPVFYAFGQTGYGKPGYDMLSGKWDFYYMVGAGLRWNIWDWSSTRREKQLIEHRQQMLLNQEDAFTLEIESLSLKERAQIDRYRRSMEMESQVLRLQEEISEQAAVRLSNGTITATEYIMEMNKESLARIKLATHGIRLCESIVNYLTIQGDF